MLTPITLGGEERSGGREGGGRKGGREGGRMEGGRGEEREGGWREEGREGRKEDRLMKSMTHVVDVVKLPAESPSCSTQVILALTHCWPKTAYKSNEAPEETIR